AARDPQRADQREDRRDPPPVASAAPRGIAARHSSGTAGPACTGAGKLLRGRVPAPEGAASMLSRSTCGLTSAAFCAAGLGGCYVVPIAPDGAYPAIAAPAYVA